jgi:pimeloyl-ACP methyl ester carboxylesterase
VHLFDMVGYGQSGKRAGQDVSLATQTGLFTALLDHWQLHRPDVLAHDFGGTIALRAHLLAGVDYRRLLLIDPVAARPWGSPFVQHVRDHEAAFAGLPDYLQRALVSAYLRTAIHRAIPDAELEPYVAPWLGPDGQPALYRQIAQMAYGYTDEIEPLLGEMRCPVSLLWGEADQWIPLEAGRALAERLRPQNFRIVAGSGHLVQEDAPEAILDEALSFLGDAISAR